MVSIILTCFGKWIDRSFAYPKIEILQVAAYGSVEKWTLTINIGHIRIQTKKVNCYLKTSTVITFLRGFFFFFFFALRGYNTLLATLLLGRSAK